MATSCLKHEVIQSAHLARTNCTAVECSHANVEKKNLVQDINCRPLSIFVDEATDKAGEISYFGKHQKIVTIF